MPSTEELRDSIPEGVDIVVEAQVKETESKEKVSAAVSNLFPRASSDLREENGIVSFVSQDAESLRFIKDQFRDRRVRAVARRLLLSNGGKENGESTFLLFNKQVATVSIAVLCEDPSESALGPIVLRIRSRRLRDVIEWLTSGYTSNQGENRTLAVDTS